jgi:hypothetical protein
LVVQADQHTFLKKLESCPEEDLGSFFQIQLVLTQTYCLRLNLRIQQHFQSVCFHRGQQIDEILKVD